MVGQYWKSVLGRAASDALAAIKLRGAQAIILALIGLAAPWVASLMTSDFTRPLTRTIESATLVFAGFVLFFLWELVAAPARLSAEKEAHIEELEQQLGKAEAAQIDLGAGDVQSVRSLLRRHSETATFIRSRHRHSREEQLAWWSDLIVDLRVTLGPEESERVAQRFRVIGDPTIPVGQADVLLKQLHPHLDGLADQLSLDRIEHGNAELRDYVKARLAILREMNIAGVQ